MKREIGHGFDEWECRFCVVVMLVILELVLLRGKSESVISIWVLMLPGGAALQRTRSRWNEGSGMSINQGGE